MKNYLLLIVVAVLTNACKEQLPIPKPPLYLRSDLPKHEYVKYTDNCPYDFEVSKLYKVNAVIENGTTTCHKEIDLGPLNGLISFSYIDMKEPLSVYVNYSNDKVGEHKIKATGIESENYISKEKKVYGTFFKLQGDVATPFQFYLTDSVKNFVNGVVYFNSRPNYDSLRPSLDYLEQDLIHMINTFEWKN
ncbi:MAG: hypothetical protein M9916_02445 [Crocinitomicaceae bacterium]|nr:hypothetical protein [Crocinitomicaceae bacterium]